LPGAAARVERARQGSRDGECWKREIAPASETDHVTLRRILVDRGRLERSADGSAYRVGFPSRTVAFDLEIWELDLRATIAAYREQLGRRKRPTPPPGGSAA
jgi:hypothetical protein